MITTILPFLSFSITAGAKRSVFNVQECTPTQLRAETPIHTDTQKHTHIDAHTHTHTYTYTPKNTRIQTHIKKCKRRKTTAPK